MDVRVGVRGPPRRRAEGRGKGARPRVRHLERAMAIHWADHAHLPLPHHAASIISDCHHHHHHHHHHLWLLYVPASALHLRPTRHPVHHSRLVLKPPADARDFGDGIVNIPIAIGLLRVTGSRRCFLAARPERRLCSLPCHHSPARASTPCTDCGGARYATSIALAVTPTDGFTPFSLTNATTKYTNK